MYCKTQNLIKLPMSKHSTPKEMVSTINKSMISCSTPERHEDSPSRDSDSTICDSDCASPVPFLCTQDGAEGETDVVWNFYTPKSGSTSNSRAKNTTPLSRRPKKTSRAKTIEKHIPKRRPVRPSPKKSQLLQDLYELNQNLHELMPKKQTAPERPESGSEEDIFKSQDCSPKCIPKSSSRCLRKNVLSSNFGKPDADPALESDDSMNEYLLRASQIVEEEIINKSVPLKIIRYENRSPYFQTAPNKKLDSMDMFVNIGTRLDSPILNRVECESPHINNDSFDNFVGNLNDSALEQLSQMPIMADLSNTTSKTKDWTVKELVLHDSSPMSKSFLSRHNSMPASPSLQDKNRPSTSRMSFGRYSSMPFHNDEESTAPGDSPIKCTPEEIKKKHQLAREKLMAKRLPFTSQQMPVQKKGQFELKIATSTDLKINISAENLNNDILPVIDINLGQSQFQPETATSISEMDLSANKANVPTSRFQPQTATSNISNNYAPVHSGNVSKSQFQPNTATSNISNNYAPVHNGNVSKSQFQPKTATCTNSNNYAPVINRNVTKSQFQPNTATCTNSNNYAPVLNRNVTKSQFQPNTATCTNSNNYAPVLNRNVTKSQFQSNTATCTNSNNYAPVLNRNVSKSQFQPKTTSTISKSNAPVLNINTSKAQFQYKTSSSTINLTNNVAANNVPKENGYSTSIDLKQLIEKKRQKALMKLQRRQPQNK